MPKEEINASGLDVSLIQGEYTAVTSEGAARVEVGSGSVAHLGYPAGCRFAAPTGIPAHKKGTSRLQKGSEALRLSCQLAEVPVATTLGLQPGALGAGWQTHPPRRPPGWGRGTGSCRRASVRPGGHVGVRKRQSESLSALDCCFIYLFFLHQIPSAGFCGSEAGYK